MSLVLRTFIAGLKQQIVHTIMPIHYAAIVMKFLNVSFFVTSVQHHSRTVSF